MARQSLSRPSLHLFASPSSAVAATWSYSTPGLSISGGEKIGKRGISVLNHGVSRRIPDFVVVLAAETTDLGSKVGGR